MGIFLFNDIFGRVDFFRLAERRVEKEEARALSDAHSCVSYVEVSVKTGEGFGTLFSDLAKSMLDRYGK